MMLLWMRCKARALEKVENLYRTATAQKNLPSQLNKSNHARSILISGTSRFAKRRAVITVARTHHDSGRPRLRQPFSPDPHPLPDMSHFAAEL
jgi:hypothetical protein